MRTPPGKATATDLVHGLGRRGFLLAAAGVSAGLVGAACSGAPAGAAAPPGPIRTLQPLAPGTPPPAGTYVPASPQGVVWGRLPTRASAPVAVVDSGAVVTIDTISHEGILEDQGKDPRAYFSGHGVAAGDVLDDAAAVAAGTPHDGPGPHVITGPIAVRGAEPGHTLAVDVLELVPRVPYGVISNRHGKGALPGEYPEAWEGRADLRPWFNAGGEISVFTPARPGASGLVGVLPAGAGEVTFPLAPFLGLMGVARDTTALVDSVPPTDSGGNIDINELGVGSRLYLPVRVPGALFFAGDPHFAQGDGEVALTALEGSLRATVRLTTIPPGGPVPAAAVGRPFAESPTHWIPIGLSDPDGPEGGGNQTSLDLAMKDAVRQAMLFLVRDRGMAEPVAYAYLSAAADFQVSQVVDRTTGVHGLIRKADFGV
ncbi:acetamidase/formamidase family protein [Actinomycetospora straminea]|uniref:Acetamidase/formamidase family protein n=1 Tax=Actinomycetospora straminea TaxID=663607 RepID=A0ABP9EK97_9PSEU|nr:acetamidase/formamidase family protein [Actinomycetospora straminea]MDD7933828.1 acetamidase/formamidase family protein [Actinomycetospora straminea]